jgi:hypothetical protein
VLDDLLEVEHQCDGGMWQVNVEGEIDIFAIDGTCVTISVEELAKMTAGIAQYLNTRPEETQ